MTDSEGRARAGASAGDDVDERKDDVWSTRAKIVVPVAAALICSLITALVVSDAVRRGADCTDVSCPPGTYPNLVTRGTSAACDGSGEGIVQCVGTGECTTSCVQLSCPQGQELSFGVEGQFACRYAADPCANVDCGLGGECVPQGGSAACLCADGMISVRTGCELPACGLSGCGPHGICNDPAPRCDCENGYIWQAESEQCIAVGDSNETVTSVSQRLLGHARATSERVSAAAEAEEARSTLWCNRHPGICEDVTLELYERVRQRAGRPPSQVYQDADDLVALLAVVRAQAQNSVNAARAAMDEEQFELVIGLYLSAAVWNGSRSAIYGAMQAGSWNGWDERKDNVFDGLSLALAYAAGQKTGRAWEYLCRTSTWVQAIKSDAVALAHCPFLLPETIE